MDWEHRLRVCRAWTESGLPDLHDGGKLAHELLSRHRLAVGELRPSHARVRTCQNLEGEGEGRRRRGKGRRMRKESTDLVLLRDLARLGHEDARVGAHPRVDLLGAE